MARTRGSSNVIHADDGELLDKEGKPIPTGGSAWSGVAGQPNPDAVEAVEIPPVPTPETTRWRCDARTVQRNMDARDLFVILELLLGDSLSLELDGEAFSRLHPDVKQHFRRIS